MQYNFRYRSSITWW